MRTIKEQTLPLKKKKTFWKATCTLYLKLPVTFPKEQSIYNIHWFTYLFVLLSFIQTIEVHMGSYFSTCFSSSLLLMLKSNRIRVENIYDKCFSLISKTDYIYITDLTPK